MEDVNSGTLDNLLAAADNNNNDNNIGNSDIDTISLLQQLLIATASLKASMDTFDVTMNEMKNHQTDMQATINHIENVVFSTEIHGTRFNKPQLGHDIDVMNEANIQIDGADNDVGNDTNNATLDVGNDANSSTPDDGNDAVKPVLDKYNLSDEFDAEDYTFINNDVNNDGKMINNDDEVHDNNNDDKTLNTLRVSFGTINHNDGNHNSLQNLFNVDLEKHRNISTDGVY